MAATAILGVAAIAVIVAGAISRRENAETRRRFILAGFATVGAEDIALSWSKTSMKYSVVGNRALEVNDHISESMSRLSQLAGVAVDRGSPADIAFMFDENIFLDLKHRPEKFISAGFTSAQVNFLKEHMPPSGEGCAMTAFSNSGHDIVLAVVLAQSPNADCILQGAFNSFGIQLVNQAERVRAEQSLCALYSARSVGVRKVSDVSEFNGTAAAHCLRPQHDSIAKEP
ncbi:MAG: hypothetical protein ABL893_19405 [Hyphomicrobium sp.]